MTFSSWALAGVPFCFGCLLAGWYFGYRLGKKHGSKMGIGEEIHYKQVHRACETLEKALGPWAEGGGYTVDTLARWVVGQLPNPGTTQRH